MSNLAYNSSYSTCLGRIGTYKGVNKFGTSTLDLPDGLLGLLKDHLIGEWVSLVSA